MANKFTYSKMIRTIEGDETFTVTDAASFDEAMRVVNKGVYDRILELEAKKPEAPTGKITVTPPAGDEDEEEEEEDESGSEGADIGLRPE